MSALLGPLTLASDPIPSMKNPPSIVTSVTIVIACDRAHASFVILDISTHFLHNLGLGDELFSRINPVLLTSSLASLTIPAILSDIMLDETLSTSPMFCRNFAFSKPYLLSCKPFLSIYLFLAISRSNVLFMEIPEVVSIVILSSKGATGSVAFRVIAGEVVLMRYMDIYIMPFEIGRAAENGLLS